jgi:hypothetical protein
MNSYSRANQQKSFNCIRQQKVMLPSSQTMVINSNNPMMSNNSRSFSMRDTHSCDDIIDHCNNNDINNIDNRLSSICNNPYAKVSLDKLNCSNNFIVATPTHFQHQQNYHHSIFYGQQYGHHRVQPSTFMATTTGYNGFNPPPPPIRLTDSFEQLSVNRHSGSSFMSTSASPPAMEDRHRLLVSSTQHQQQQQQQQHENTYECIPAHYCNNSSKVVVGPTSDTEAITRI